MSGGMSQGFVGSSSDGSRASREEKDRANLFARSEEQKNALKNETAQYRLKAEGDKFSSSTNAPDVALQQATVGLVTKEEVSAVARYATLISLRVPISHTLAFTLCLRFTLLESMVQFARRKAAIASAAAGDEPPAAASTSATAVPLSAKEKKKKKAKQVASLSFALDDEDGEGEEALAEPPPKKKPKVVPAAEGGQREADSSSGGAGAASTSTLPAAAVGSTTTDAPATIAPMPAGYSCVKRCDDGSFELSTEVRASANLPKTRVVSISSHAFVLDVKGRDQGGESNAALCAFLRSVLGGPSLGAEVVRGHRAPVKTVRITGSDLAVDLLYHRLLLAKEFGKR